ncbi:hypothetical protein B0H19DRAFT_1273400 [Mycena capillaripes]|nr:hypothetical protein B0H19DRAFT_1273400 [Mycena capillaripes]
MSSNLTPFSALGPLSNREPEYQNQDTPVPERNGQLRYAIIRRPVLTLPLEILTEIFLDCLLNDDFLIPDPTSAPLILCGVCRRWREGYSPPQSDDDADEPDSDDDGSDMSPPRLWSFSFDKKVARDTGFYQMWLSRARDTPLSLSLREAHGFASGLWKPPGGSEVN